MRRLLAEPAAVSGEGRGEVCGPSRGGLEREVGGHFTSVAFLISDKFFNEFARRPIGEVVRGG